MESTQLAAAESNSLRVTFLGPLASFSHQAALESFGSEATLLPQTSFAEAFLAVQSNEADYAVIPFENSTNGSVVQTLDLLADRDAQYSDITVCGEYYLTVHHCLLAKKLDGNKNNRDTSLEGNDSGSGRYNFITKLYTHPQAWGQCETFLSQNFKGVERQDVSSTSKAAEIVSRENDDGDSSAAIASKFAADHHGLEVLAENIEDRDDNTTRFLILRNAKTRNGEAPPPTTTITTTTTSHSTNDGPLKWKTLISFMIDHSSPGALVNALVVFERYGLNLTSINTRPGLIHPWQYIFFVECERIRGVHDDNTVDKVMENLQKVTQTCRDLGSWKDQLDLTT